MNKGFHSENNAQALPPSTGSGQAGSAQAKPPFAVYLSASVIMFVLLLSVADSIGFVPDYLDGTQAQNQEAPLAVNTTNSNDIPEPVGSLPVSNLPELGPEPAPAVVTPTAPAANAQTAKPTKIIIPAIGMDLPVQNPTTRDLAALDTLLQKGPARYVDSAKLGMKGNVIIFAHSSNLPVVKNQMYKAFNRVPELSAGDSITIVGDDGKKYLYSVTSVRKANASDATIDLSPRIGTKLTLVTCDTLTSKDARFILEADFIGTI